MHQSKGKPKNPQLRPSSSLKVHRQFKLQKNIGSRKQLSCWGRLVLEGWMALKFGQSLVLELTKQGALKFGQSFVLEINQKGGFKIWAESCA